MTYVDEYRESFSIPATVCHTCQCYSLQGAGTEAEACTNALCPSNVELGSFGPS